MRSVKSYHGQDYRGEKDNETIARLAKNDSRRIFAHYRTSKHYRPQKEDDRARKFEKSPELKTLMHVYPYTHNMHTSISVCIHVGVLTMYIIRLLNRAEKRRTRTYYQSLATDFPSLLVPSLTSASLFAFRKARLSEMRRPGSCRLRKGVISEWVGCEGSAKCQIRRGASVKQPNHHQLAGRKGVPTRITRPCCTTPPREGGMGDEGANIEDAGKNRVPESVGQDSRRKVGRLE